MLLGLPVMALPAGVAMHRAYEIPAVSPGVSPEAILEPVPAEAIATADIYRRAIADLEPLGSSAAARGIDDWESFGLGGWDRTTEAEREWLAKNRGVVELTLGATRRPACVFHDPGQVAYWTNLDDVQGTRFLAWLLVVDARRLESEGSLDEALERYFAVVRLGHHVANRGALIQYLTGRGFENLAAQYMPGWAAHEDQSADKILAARARVRSLVAEAPSVVDAAKVEYVMMRRLLSSEHMAEVVSEEHLAPVMVGVVGAMPWALRGHADPKRTAWHPSKEV